MNLAVGFFDGVHLGHRRILSLADEALTFLNHPASVCAPERAPRLLMTAQDRIEAVRAALRIPGGRVEALTFTSATASTAPEAFATWLQRSFPGLDTVVCGENWTFGEGGKGDAGFLRHLGFKVETVPFVLYEGSPISSTRIRQELAEARPESAAAMLGRRYAVSGHAVRGKGVGHLMGRPTLNIVPDLDDVPLARGVYAVVANGRPGVANWGTAPTFGDQAWPEPLLEVHLLDGSAAPTSGEGAALRVEFASFLRPERKFSSRAELARQISADAAAAADALAGA